MIIVDAVNIRTVHIVNGLFGTFGKYQAPQIVKLKANINSPTTFTIIPLVKIDTQCTK